MALAAGKSTETYKDQFNLMKTFKRYLIEKMAKYRGRNIFTYSSVPNRRSGWNKHAGGKIPKKH